ncbi:hypothetical protein ZHAS_00011393 [Anopheles sinensis]|uniref:Uncharacterized protein n=1 Tax=Anopheles sinensis TaxID=74873 RepID=A0A084W0C2_ANOSI|nr:hypothetical protein ZHAS_00011393 [Anopheles sinensis]
MNRDKSEIIAIVRGDLLRLPDKERRKLLNDVTNPKDFVRNESLVVMLKKVFKASDPVVQCVDSLRMLLRMSAGEKVDEVQRADLFEEFNVEDAWRNASNGESRSRILGKMTQDCSQKLAGSREYVLFKDIVMQEVGALK